MLSYVLVNCYVDVFSGVTNHTLPVCVINVLLMILLLHVTGV